MSTPFMFKQFAIHQDQCAMKVGTDGVLLGAWANINHHPESVLDIGSGTGLIALMLAQRSQATLIDALEIDDKAFEQCVTNFENSPWNDRLFCYHASLDEFTSEIDENYDLIVSNPPFYSERVSSGNLKRDQARTNDFLPFDELLQSVASLLHGKGKFCVIIPYKEEENFVLTASRNQLLPERITRIKGHPLSETKRSLLTFSFKKAVCTFDELTIEHERHQYTSEYIELTREFYLKM